MVVVTATVVEENEVVGLSRPTLKILIYSSTSKFNCIFGSIKILGFVNSSRHSRPHESPQILSDNGGTSAQSLALPLIRSCA